MTVHFATRPGPVATPIAAIRGERGSPLTILGNARKNVGAIVYECIKWAVSVGGR